MQARRIIHILCSAWLASLLILGTTPPEFIHRFTAHRDTVDHELRSSEVCIEKAHHHCSFLHFVLEPFDGGYRLPKLRFFTPGYPCFGPAPLPVLASVACPHANKRGPPVS